MPAIVQFVTGLRPATALLLLLGAMGLYLASLAAADALMQGQRASVAQATGAGHWMPIVAVAWIAAGYGQSQIALGVVFGSSVAALSLAMGLVTYVTPPVGVPPHGRAWPFLLAGSLLTLIAGFSSHLSALHAMMLLVLGGSVGSVWQGPRDGSGQGAGRDDAGAATRPAFPRQPASSQPANPPTALLAAQWLLAAALAVIAARAALLGAAQAQSESRFFHASLLSAAVLSPILLLPLLAGGTELARRGRSSEGASALVALVALNLFALLPMIILLWWFRTASPAGGFWDRFAAIRQGQPIPLSLSLWRIDVVLLTVLSFALIPMSLGKWAIQRFESACLIIVYAAYLALSAWMTRAY